MNEVEIRFTAEVVRSYRHNDNWALTLKVEDGSKYGGKATVWSDVEAGAGDVVEVTTNKMPYVKRREYTDRDGETKLACDIIYPSASVRLLQSNTVDLFGTTQGLPDDFDAEIPF